jgi:hypothetical protein
MAVFRSLVTTLHLESLSRQRTPIRRRARPRLECLELRHLPADLLSSLPVLLPDAVEAPPPPAVTAPLSIADATDDPVLTIETAQQDDSAELPATKDDSADSTLTDLPVVVSAPSPSPLAVTSPQTADRTPPETDSTTAAETLQPPLPSGSTSTESSKQGQPPAAGFGPDSPASSPAGNAFHLSDAPPPVEVLSLSPAGCPLDNEVQAPLLFDPPSAPEAVPVARPAVAELACTPRSRKAVDNVLPQEFAVAARSEPAAPTALPRAGAVAVSDGVFAAPVDPAEPAEGPWLADLVRPTLAWHALEQFLALVPLADAPESVGRDLAALLSWPWVASTAAALVAVELSRRWTRQAGRFPAAIGVPGTTGPSYLTW